jgi:hypothetical protein
LGDIYGERLEKEATEQPKSPKKAPLLPENPETLYFWFSPSLNMYLIAGL